MNTLSLTVEDVLTRDTFQCAQVIAGANGLHRKVRWSHIVEMKEFESFINGGELIFTTGAGLKFDLPTQLAYVQKLIEHNTSGLCLELGIYFKAVPPEIIELANEHDFPLIVFNEIVKFVDITQDLHTHIINKHYESLAQLDKLSKKFSELSLVSNGILKILQELYDFFQQNTLFISNNLKPFYFPSNNKKLEENMRTYLENSSKEFSEQQFISLNEEMFAITPVTGLGQIWGYLCLQVEDMHGDEFPFLILDRAALAITQILLRNRTIEERKQNLEGEFVQNLLQGKQNDPAHVKTYLPATNPNMHFRVFIIKMNSIEITLDEETWEEIKLQRTMMIRALFERYGFFPAIAAGKTTILVIASFIVKENHLQTNKFTQIIEHVSNMKQNNFIDGKKCTFGVSMIYKDIANAELGYEEAKEVLTLHDNGIIKTYFYENLGIYRLLPLLQTSGHLQRFIDDYLTPIIDYDKKTGSDLLTTLTVFLECGGVIKTASDRLFIVRQTLYHRLERLKKILGDGFMEPTNRLALEVAVKAYEMIKDKKSE